MKSHQRTETLWQTMSDIELVDRSLQNISLVILLASHFPLESSAMCERRLWEDTRWSGRWSGSRQHLLSHHFLVALFLSFLRRYATPTTLLYFVVDRLDINICCCPKTWDVSGRGRHACERDDGERLLLSWEHKTCVLTPRPDNRGHVDVCWKLWKGVYVGQGWR